MLKVLNSVFLGILLNENYYLKAKLMETKFIYRVTHVCIEFKLKFSDRSIFPAFLTTQIDQSSPADSGLHRPWRAPKDLKLP